MSATEKTQKRRLGKVLRIYRRAFGLVCRESGGYTAILVVEKVLDTCMPYWDIWFTARLLDEIWGGRSPKLLVLSACGKSCADFSWTIPECHGGPEAVRVLPEGEHDIYQKDHGA